MRVVFSESCPNAWLMDGVGMFSRWAALAQQCLAVYVVSGIGQFTNLPIFFSWTFTR